jgi:hypothetical protein
VELADGMTPCTGIHGDTAWAERGIPEESSMITGIHRVSSWVRGVGYLGMSSRHAVLHLLTNGQSFYCI